MEPKSPSKRNLSKFSDLNKRKLKIGIVIGVDSLLLLGALYSAFKLLEDRDINSYFNVVLDCGSTVTRVSVYEWLSRDVNPGELPVLRNTYPESSSINGFRKGSCQYHCLQTKTGLDKFIGTASGVREALEPLIKLAKQWVPIEKHKDTPIYVLATAGLRRVAEEDARRVLDDVEVVLKDHEFFPKRSHVRVLSGKEEAYCGWVALNYKMGRLGNSSKFPTLGLLDLGGSSLQVAVEERKEVNGHLWNYTCYDCLKLNLTYQKNSNQNAKAVSVNMVGEPNWEHCMRLARAVATTNISISIYAGGDSETFPSLALAVPEATFHALSGFYAI